MELLVAPVAIESLQYVTPSQFQGKLLHPLKHKLAQNVHAQLYFIFLSGSTIITQLLLPCLEIELHLLPVSEMGKFHTLALYIGG